jgi:hypothetical protein
MILRFLTFAAILALPVCAQKIAYTKVFPGSKPAYVKIVLAKDGALTYQEEADDPEPITANLRGEESAAMFDLAEKLNHFQTPIESGLKVAKTGDKTFRWEQGATSTQAVFNHTNDENARLLHDWFERITESERTMIDLERTYKYDRLGVNEVVLRLDTAWRLKRLVGAPQFIPMLTRIAKNESLLNMARERAADLSDSFKAIAAVSK